MNNDFTADDRDRMQEEIDELRQALAEAEKQEPEPEPITVEFREYLTRLNWQQGFERGWDEAVEKLTLTQEKLGYTAPLKKEWVGLTDEDINFYWAMATEREAERHFPTGHHAFASLIQDKLKRLNT